MSERKMTLGVRALLAHIDEVKKNEAAAAEEAAMKNSADIESLCYYLHDTLGVTVAPQSLERPVTIVDGLTFTSRNDKDEQGLFLVCPNECCHSEHITSLAHLGKVLDENRLAPIVSIKNGAFAVVYRNAEAN